MKTNMIVIVGIAAFCGIAASQVIDFVDFIAARVAILLH